MDNHGPSRRQDRPALHAARALTAMASGAGNFQFLAGLFFVLGMLDAARADADFKKCCVMAARASYPLFLPILPWDACAVNSNATGSSAPINPSVNATLGWCEQNCPGYQPSTTSEWLHPITTWIIPYAGLLFLCPIGERSETAVDRSVSWFLHWFRWLPQGWRTRLDGTKSWTIPMMNWVSNVIFSTSEYAGFLGDPASAIWGAFSELAEDWWLSGIVLHKTELRRELVATVILTGQSELDENAEKRLTNTLITRFLLEIIGHENSQDKRGSQDKKSQDTKSEIFRPIEDNPSRLPPTASKEMGAIVLEQERSPPLTTGELRRKLELYLEKEGENLWDNIDTNRVAKAVVDITEGHDAPPGLFSSGSTNTRFTTALNQVMSTYNKRPALERRALLLRNGTFTHRLWDGIRVLLEARVDFVNTVVIPVILMLVVTAAVFYDAYEALGDNDTAHSLAYGLLYSWLIILAVAANCYTSSLTSGLVERTIGNSADVLPISSVTVGLCSRYTNALRWRRWLANVGVVENPVHDKTSDPDKTSVPGTASVLVKYLAGQLFGWACVAVVASCGAAVSYTTPTVGVGCRSFNMLLYALVSLLVCLFPVLLYWNELQAIKPGKTNKTAAEKRATFHKYTSWLYRFLVFANGCVLLIGTLLHLIGIFRSCWCMNVFAHHSRLLELNTQTAQAVHNATVYWLPVGYVAFIFIWCVSASAIIMRQVINFRIGIMQNLRLGERMGKGKEDASLVLGTGLGDDDKGGVGNDYHG